jgi:ABC-type antimicrobial peptide transport system permease subunit
MRKNILFSFLNIFGFAAGFAVCMVLTVSWQSWMAARRNPVEALRYE